MLPPVEAWLEPLEKEGRDLGAGLDEEMAELTAELILGWRLEMMFLTRPLWLEPNPEPELTRRTEATGTRGATGIRGATATGRELAEIAPWTAEDIWGWMEARIWAIRSDWERPEGLGARPETAPLPTSSMPARGPSQPTGMFLIWTAPGWTSLVCV